MNVLPLTKPLRSLPQKRELRLLLLWFVIGLLIRLTHLTLKPVWMDEVSTVIFSLGNSSHELLLDHVLSLGELLQPLKPDASATISDSVRYLLQENNHPPLYFAIAHQWMSWFPSIDEVASIAAARALPALFGAVSIPLAYLVSRITFQSTLAGQITAAFMAVSPYGVFLSQEARHYSFAIVLILGSLACFAAAAQKLQAGKPPSLLLCLGWIVVNGFCFANHYFSALTFAAEGLTFLVWAWRQGRQQANVLLSIAWLRIYLVATGTAIGVLVWLPVLMNFYGSNQTSIVQADLTKPIDWLNPIAQTLAAWVFSILTPITHSESDFPLKWTVIIAVAVMMLMFLVALIRVVVPGFHRLNQTPKGQVGLRIMGGFLVAMLLIFGLICYVYGADITRGLRYIFVYYPALIILLGGALSVYWNDDLSSSSRSSSIGPVFNYRAVPMIGPWLNGKRIVKAIWVVSLVSSLFVVNNLAFAKFYISHRFVSHMQRTSEHPVVLTILAPMLEQPTVIGTEILSVGWEVQRHFSPSDPQSGWIAPPQFIVIKSGYGSTRSPDEQLTRLLSEIPHPIDLWTLNFWSEQLGQTCFPDETDPRGNRGGHNYGHYICKS